MADSILEQIVKKMASAVAEVTVANGYDNTVLSVQRFNQSGVELADVPAVLIREGVCDVERLKSTHQSVRRRAEIVLVGIIRQDETSTSTDTRSAAEQLNSLCADLEYRLGASLTWDGLAIDTEPPNYIEVEMDAVTPHAARGLQVSVVFQHVRNDPYTQ